jgi:hypothetical protein
MVGKPEYRCLAGSVFSIQDQKVRVVRRPFSEAEVVVELAKQTVHSDASDETLWGGLGGWGH